MTAQGEIDLEARTAPRLALRIRPALRRRENWRQLVRFGLVGASGYIINLAVFSLLVLRLGVDYRLAAAAAFGVAVANNFTWNRRWTFGVREASVVPQAARFLGVSVACFVLNVLILDLQVRVMHASEVGAQAAAVAVVVPVSYVGNRLWTFADREEPVGGVGTFAVAVAVGLVAAVSGLGLLLLSSPNGLVVSSDSVAFADAGHNLADGRGLSLSGSYTNLEPTLKGAQDFPLVHWAPLYPAALGAGEWLGGSTADVARYVAALLLAANICVLGLVIWRMTRSRVATVLGAALVAMSPIGLSRHAFELSEPLFLLFLLGGLELLARHLRTRRTGLLVAACAVLSLALLSRYAGLPVLAVVLVSLLVLGRGELRRRLLVAGAATLAVAVPLAGWLLRNVAEAGTATGRSGATWHPPGLNELGSAVGALAQWLAPAALSPAPRALFAAVVATLLVGGMLALSRSAAVHLRPTSDQGVRLLLLGAFVVLYGAFLLLSRSLLDAANPLNDRGFAPLYAGSVAIVLTLVTSALHTPRARRLSRGAAAVALGGLLVVGAYAQQTATAASHLRRGEAAGDPQEGYLGDEWRSSATLTAVRAVGPATKVYSNAPDAILVATGRRALTVPVRTDPISGRAYAGYAPAMAALRREVHDGRAVVAWFDGVDRGYLPSLAELQQRAGLKVVSVTDDGSILGP